MTKLRTWFALAMTLSGCTIQTDRSGYSDAYYYERLGPYYTKDLALTPRVHLRAVKGLIGIDFVGADGVAGNADYLRSDIEFFFARSVMVEKERLRLALRAIEITCPATDLAVIEENLAENIVYSSPTYVVLIDAPCLGTAG